MMKDGRGHTPEDEEFFELDKLTWVRVRILEDPPKNTGRYIYQKVIDDYTIPLVLSSDTDCGAPTYWGWRERITGMTKEQILKTYQTITGGGRA